MEGTIEYGEKVKLDIKDKKILKILHDDGRASIAAISRKTGIPRDSVMYRINRMIKSKVIRFFHVILNPSLMGYEIYSFVSLTLHNLTHEKESRFLNYIQSHPNITYIARVTGKHDFIITITAENIKEFDNIITQIRIKFSDIIRDYDTSSIIQEVKYDYMAELVK